MLLVRSLFSAKVPHMILDPLTDGKDCHLWVNLALQAPEHGTSSVMVAIPPGEERGLLVRALRREGFVPSVRPLVAMVNRELQVDSTAPDTFRIALARTAAELSVARSIMAQVFGHPAEVFAFHSAPQVISTFLAYHHDRCVGAACIYPYRDSIGNLTVWVSWKAIDGEASHAVWSSTR